MAKNEQDVFSGFKNTNIVDDIVATGTNRFLLESSFPFYIVYKSNNPEKVQKNIIDLLDKSEAVDEIRAMDSQDSAIVGFIINLNSKYHSQISKILLAINKHADYFGKVLSVVYNNGKMLEVILEIANGQLTQEQANLAVQLMVNLQSVSRNTKVNEIEETVQNIHDTSERFMSILRRGYIESGDIIDGPVRREMEYLFGEYGKNHACNKWYLIEAENLKNSSILDNDIFTYECFPYIKEKRDGDELIEHSPMLCDSTTNPSRTVALFANVNNTDPMKKGYPDEDGSIKFFGVYECHYKGKDECVEFQRKSTRLDILLILLKRRIAKIEPTNNENN